VSTEAWLTLALTVGALVLFATEVVTVDLAALLVLSALLVCNLVTPEEGVSGFSNPATITVLCLFILSAGLQKAGVVERISRWVVRGARGSELRGLFLLLLVVTGLSAFINNTAAVALLLPVGIALARSSNSTPSRFLIPLSYASIVGGLLTLVGTSTNLLASALLEQLGHRRFGLFEFTAAGLVHAGVMILMLLFVVRPRLPRRGTEAGSRFDLDEFIIELDVPPESPAAGKTLAELSEALPPETRILHRLPGSGEERNSGSGEVDAGDRILLSGPKEKVARAADLLGLSFKNRSTTGSRSQLGIYEVIITPHAHLVGRNLREARFAERYGGSVVAVRRRHRILRHRARIASAHLGAGDSLLVAGTAGDVERWKASGDLLLIEQVESAVPDRKRLLLAVAIFAGVMAASALGLASIMVASIVGASLMAVTGVLRMRDFHEAIRWDVIFLLAGLIPLGIAVQKSGLAHVVAEGLAGLARGLPPLIFLMLVQAITSALTELLSNAASVVIMTPIASSAALQLDCEPRTFVLAVCFGASMSFLTPFGYQTNAIVYGPGGYRFRDYFRAGWPMSLVLAVLSPLVLATFFPLRR
jgi:di/tricarboxylate transporter